MDKNILAKNLIILKQLENIAAEFRRLGIPAVLLKGAALIISFPGYAKTRNMEDIDVLLAPEDTGPARKALHGLGYRSLSEDPFSMANPSLPAPVDLSDNLWYLDKEENAAVFADGLKHPLEGFSGCMHRLKPEDFYIHVLAHAALHHAEDNLIWKNDLSLMWDNWGKTINRAEVENKLKAYGFFKAANTYLSEEKEGNSLYLRLLRSKNNPFKGHVTRFIFLPLGKKLNFIRSAIFPSEEFLVNRYRIKTRFEILFYAFLRPFLLLKNLAVFAKRLLF